MWELNKSLLSIGILNSLLNAFYPFIRILSIKIIIDELMGLKRINYLIFILSLSLVTSVVIKTLTSRYNSVFKIKMGEIRFKFIDLIHEKSMNMEYKYTEDSDILNDIQIAWSTVGNPNRGIGGVLKKTFIIIENIIGLIGYIIIIVTLSPSIVIF